MTPGVSVKRQQGVARALALSNPHLFASTVAISNAFRTWVQIARAPAPVPIDMAGDGGLASNPSRRAALGLPSDFVRKMLLLRSGYVRELAAASYPHIQCGGSDFSGIAGGLCGERRLT